MIKVGLTGGIGAGKTTVSQIFKERGFPIFNSDLCAREAEKEEHIQLGFKNIIDDNIFVDGVLDRDRLRSIIFTDKEKLKQVNRLIGPYVKAKFEKFCEDHEKNHQVCMLESAIIFENKAEEGFDYVVTVTATENTRIRRVMHRDNITVDVVMNKLANQLPELEKISKSQFIVINDGYDLIDSIELLTKQVDAIIKAIKYDAIIIAADGLADALTDITKEGK